MSEWWTYSISDFLLFSPGTYYRLLELYNRAVWPAQLAGLGAGLAIVALLALDEIPRRRVVSGLLALAWGFVAVAFHYERYAQINWAAPWFALAFALEAVLFVLVGIVAGSLRWTPPRGAGFVIGLALVAAAVVGYPLLALLAGRPWSTTEIFGVAPDPTAIATAGALALVRGKVRWLLLVVPLAWCGVTASTLWAMHAPEALVVALAAALAVLVAVFAGARRPSAQEPAAP